MFALTYDSKNILAILRPHAALDTVEECVISVIDPVLDAEDADADGGSECRLVVRLFCKHGQTSRGPYRPIMA
jgi:hypothetical protein